MHIPDYLLSRLPYGHPKFYFKEEGDLVTVVCTKDKPGDFEDCAGLESFGKRQLPIFELPFSRCETIARAFPTGAISLRLRGFEKKENGDLKILFDIPVFLEQSANL